MSAMNFLIAITPLLLFVLALSFKRYPGEVAIGKLRSVIDTLRSRFSVPVPASRIWSGSKMIGSGGTLIACSLAGRGPPGPA